MANTLVSPADLVDWGDFDTYLVDVAVAALRADAGWHIAPVVTETLTVDSYGGYLLILPTRRIVSVTAVRDVTTTSEVQTAWSRMTGGLYRKSGWPAGVLEVDLTHGYTATPLDLLPVVVDYIRRASNPRDLSLASISRGPFAESYRDVGDATSPALARYAVPGGVA